MDRSGQQRRVFHVLDAIRGIAALAVTQRHLAINLHLPNSGSFLAVDLFFVLSGFVIAHAYAEKLLNGEPIWRFMAGRFIRLYPLYLIGTVAGLVATTILSPSPSIFPALVLALLMLPSLSLPALNGPRWSLFYELVGNFAYALAIRHITTAKLIAVMAVSGAAMAARMVSGGTLDTGWALADVPIALARVGYGFFAGVLLYHIHTGSAGRQALFMWLSVVLAMIVPTALLAPHKQALMLGVVLIAFPALVWLGARFDVGGAWARLWSFLGVASYAIYILHEPVGRLTYAAFKGAGVDLAYSPIAGLIMIAALLALSWALDQYYDQPVRRWFTAQLRRAPPQTSALPLGRAATAFRGEN